MHFSRFQYQESQKQIAETKQLMSTIIDVVPHQLDEKIMRNQARLLLHTNIITRIDTRYLIVRETIQLPPNLPMSEFVHFSINKNSRE
jgi:hypothetical protein